MRNHESIFMMEEGILFFKAGDYERAVECWEIAAEMGNASAMFNLGIYYLQNSLSQQGLYTAKSWFESAMQAGHKNAGVQIEKVCALMDSGMLYERKEKNISTTVNLPYQTKRFGNYTWIVLEEQEDRILLLSEYIIAIRPYHEQEESISWSSCTLRTWLNTEFFQSFAKDEREYILETRNANSGNNDYNVPDDIDTYDRVFLLSFSEVQDYLSNEKCIKQDADLLKCQNDDFLRKAYLRLDDEQVQLAQREYGHNYGLINGQALGWWLRSGGSSGSRAMRVNCHGTVRSYGREVNRNLVGVRPALWIRKEQKNG